MMKKSAFIAGLILAAGIFSNIDAQEVAPPGAGDRDLQDRNVKGRSVEMERISRDAKKSDKSKNGINTQPAGSPAAGEKAGELDLKYPEIKEDFEQLQTSYDAIIKAYQPNAIIDYKKIVESATEITKRAARLNSNLFPLPVIETKTAPEKEEKPDGKETEKTLRSLIVDLDNAVGNFTTSPIFQNLRLINSEEAAKAHSELEKIKKSSELISKKAGEKLN